MIISREPLRKIAHISKHDDIYENGYETDCLGQSYSTVFYFRKDGKIGTRPHEISNVYSRLIKCEKCGFIGSCRKVSDRYDVGIVFGYGFYRLCTSCWNKYKPLAKKINEANEIKRLTNKLTREELKWRKSQTQAN